MRIPSGEGEGRAEDGRASEPYGWGGAPPYTAPDWTGTDGDELVDVEPAVGGDSTVGADIDGLVASHVELAMKNLQRHGGRAEPDQEEDPLYRFGSGDATLYAIEDGVNRLMIGRGVGRDDEGCIYCLVGTSSPALLAVLDTGDVAPADAFDDAAELTLCSVFRSGHVPSRHFRLTALNEQVSNVIQIQRYKTLDDVPVRYRPGQPFLQFTDE